MRFSIEFGSPGGQRKPAGSKPPVMRPRGLDKWTAEIQRLNNGRFRAELFVNGSHWQYGPERRWERLARGDANQLLNRWDLPPEATVVSSRPA